MTMPDPSDLTPLQQRALELNALGIQVAAIKAGGKSPRHTWKDIEQQTPQDVLRLVTRNTERIGAICGARSNGLTMLEFEGPAVARKLDRQFRDLLKAEGHHDLYERIRAWQERSPSGGRHLHWFCPEDPQPNIQLAFAPDGKVLIETRGEGGQVVVAPSDSHISGKDQQWELTYGHPDHIGTITAAEQQIIFAIARRLDERPNQPADELPVAEEEPVHNARNLDSSIDTIIAEFNRNKPWPEILGGVFEWVSGPDSNGIERLKFIGQEGDTGATINALGTNTLIVFSGTAAGKGWQVHTGAGKAPSYDKFSAWTKINHNGDRMAALHALGYRTPDELDQHNGINQLAKTDAERAVEHDPLPATPPANTPTVLQLPDTFWQAREHLQLIRQAAHHGLVAADTLLGAVIAWIAYNTDWRHLLPPFGVIGRAGTLNVNIALVGGSGAGKGSALDLAAALLGDHHQDGHRTRIVNAGSGEGMVKAFFTTRKDPDDKRRYLNERAYDAILVRVDEGQFIHSLAQRQGQTTLEVVRSAWSGERLGGTYSNDDKNAHIPPYDYRWVLIAGVQPTLAGPLLDDEAGGTAQRQLWFATKDTHLDPQATHPGQILWTPYSWTDTTHHRATAELPIGDMQRNYLEIAPSIQEAIRLDRIEAVRDPDNDAPGHRNLAKLKTAALFALLDHTRPNRAEINDDDWELAEHVHAVSDNLADMMREKIDSERHEAARRQGTVDAARTTQRQVAVDYTKTYGKKLAQKIIDTPGKKAGWMRSNWFGGKTRQYFTGALEYAEACRWIVQSDDGTWTPGPVKVPT